MSRETGRALPGATFQLKRVRRGSGKRRFTVGTLAGLLFVPGAALGQSDSTATPEAHAPGGMFSETQADRGQRTFQNICSQCHTVGDFRGAAWEFEWLDRSVYSLFNRLRSTMPSDNPGGLKPEVYADVVAYILRLNGFPAGPTDLPAAEDALRELRMEKAEPAADPDPDPTGGMLR